MFVNDMLTMAGDLTQRIFFLRKKGVIGKRASDTRGMSTSDIFKLADRHGFSGGFQGQGISSKSGRQVSESTEIIKDDGNTKIIKQKEQPVVVKTEVTESKPTTFEPVDPNGVYIPLTSIGQASTERGTIVSGIKGNNIYESQITDPVNYQDRGYSPYTDSSKPNYAGIVAPGSNLFATTEQNAEFTNSLKRTYDVLKTVPKTLAIGSGRILTRIATPRLEKTISSNRPSFKNDPAVLTTYRVGATAAAFIVAPAATLTYSTAKGVVTTAELAATGRGGDAAVSALMTTLIGISAVKTASTSLTIQSNRVDKNLFGPLRFDRQKANFQKLISSTQEKGTTFSHTSGGTGVSGQLNLQGKFKQDIAIRTSQQAKSSPNFDPFAHPLKRFEGKVSTVDGKLVTFKPMKIVSSKTKPLVPNLHENTFDYLPGRPLNVVSKPRIIRSVPGTITKTLKTGQVVKVRPRLNENDLFLNIARDSKGHILITELTKKTAAVQTNVNQFQFKLSDIGIKQLGAKPTTPTVKPITLQQAAKFNKPKVGTPAPKVSGSTITQTIAHPKTIETQTRSFAARSEFVNPPSTIVQPRPTFDLKLTQPNLVKNNQNLVSAGLVSAQTQNTFRFTKPRRSQKSSLRLFPTQKISARTIPKVLQGQSQAQGQSQIQGQRAAQQAAQKAAQIPRIRSSSRQTTVLRTPTAPRLRLTTRTTGRTRTPPRVPRIPVVPKIPKLELLHRPGKKKKKKLSLYGRLTKYQPSLVASEFKIKRVKRKFLTGLEVRGL